MRKDALTGSQFPQCVPRDIALRGEVTQGHPRRNAGAIQLGRVEIDEAVIDNLRLTPVL